MPRDRKLSREERIRRSLEWMTRYDSLFGDPAAYLAAIEERPPIDLLIPRGPQELTLVEASLKERGYRVERFPWAPYHLRVHGEGKGGAGALPEVIFGFAFPQGVVSSLPCLALNPAPGQRVLDVCASPGGKTILLAKLADDRARLIAGDPNGQRCGLLIQSLSRIGIASALIVQQDGNSFPAVTQFDSILLDAPCTGEGTFRLPKPRYEPTGMTGIARAQALQKRLLERSLDLLAPGGRLVYSTCTFAPEENEQVLSEVLANREEITVQPLPAGFPGAPGLAQWEGTRFDPRLNQARRVYPQMTGSWGFFLALLEKRDDSGKYVSRKLRDDEDPGLPKDDPEARDILIAHLRERFGVVESDMKEFIIQRKARDIWLLGRLPEDVPDVETARLKVVAPGLRALRATGRGPRITNTLLRCLQDKLRERVIELSWETLLDLLHSRRMPLPEPMRAGQVAVRCRERIVAAGFVHEGVLELEIPKAWR